MEKDISTEEKIMTAARKVFHEKGYGQTRTRDIAEEAGINLALLNYYFRSKEKLFDIIMEESLVEMFSMVENIINNEKTTLAEKIDLIVDKYTDSLINNPNLPLFVLSEIQANPKELIQRIGIPDSIIIKSCFYKQVEEQLTSVGEKILSPLHIFINIISMSVFPVIGKPLLMNIHGNITAEEYNDFIDERRKLIPTWIKLILKMKN